MIAILSGGVGAAKFARGVASLYNPSEIRIISNTGDDEELHGLHISPDIDTVIYTLAGAINKETGWGLDGETWRTMDALSEYGGITWFKLGDKDLATHMFRTQLLRDGENLTQVTDKIRSRWGVKIRVLPVTNDPLKTVLYCNLGGSNEWLSFQEYFVKYSHSPETLRIQYNNAKKTKPTPEVIETIESAEVIFIAPSNPLLSIGPILAVSGMIELLQARRESVVAISPIIGGKAVKGPAAKLMGELGLISSSLGVAQYYKEVIDSLVIDTIDAHLLSDIRLLGIRATATDTLMTNDDVAKSVASTAVRLVKRELG